MLDDMKRVYIDYNEALASYVLLPLLVTLAYTTQWEGLEMEIVADDPEPMLLV